MSDASQQVELLPMLQELASEFTVVGDAIALPPASFEKWHAALLQQTPEAKPELTAQLIALAIKFEDKGDVAAEEGIVQLGELVMALLQNAELVMKSFAGAGVDLRKAAKLLGTDAPSHAADEEVPEGAVSMLALRKSLAEGD